jgi:hypothetical protein
VLLAPERCYAGGAVRDGWAVRLEDGRITAVGPRAALPHPSLHPPNALVKNVVYALSPQAITDVWVHGRRVVRDGHLTTLDETALLADVRALTRDWEA